jgi:hypothetical protein
MDTPIISPDGLQKWNGDSWERLQPHEVQSHYDSDYLDDGQYKHSVGSSTSSPKGGGSWIGAIRKAHEQQHFTCAQNNCENEATEGCHLKVSIVKELIKLVGLGGTAVVPLCSSHHAKDGSMVMINSTPCIWDQDSAIDLHSDQDVEFDLESVGSDGSHCQHCGGGLYSPSGGVDGLYCSSCEHFMDWHGWCDTAGCWHEKEYEQDENNDYDSDDYDRQNQNNDFNHDDAIMALKEKLDIDAIMALKEKMDKGEFSVEEITSVGRYQYNDKYCSACGNNLSASDCAYGECGECCDGDGCSRHG